MKESILKLFPPRLRKALYSYEDWDGICEIRLRREKPLSLTHYGGNLFLNEQGKVTDQKSALCATSEEIRSFVGAFCEGNVYRYFENLKEGFLVNDKGYRLGICPENPSLSSLMPERFEGANLRIPRFVLGAANPFLDHFRTRPLSSSLILSAPGAGKTTLLRDLAIALSCGKYQNTPLRVAVIDRRQELFPSSVCTGAGLCDILSGYSKKEGIEIATSLFSPQAILCDEIGGEEDAKAILSACNTGTLFFATAHSSSIKEAASRPHIKQLMDAGVFKNAAILSRLPGDRYRSTLTLEEIP